MVRWTKLQRNEVAITADEMSGSTFDSFDFGPVEQDQTPTPSRIDDFETSDEQGYATDLINRSAVDFIERNQEGPFCDFHIGLK